MAAIKIAASAHYVPSKKVTNDDLSQLMDTSDEWISSRTGIQQRHVSCGENTADLCAKVAKKLLQKSGTAAEKIDLIIVATMSPDCYTPATAAIVQGKIQAVNAAAFDVSAACSGFIYALTTAKAMMKLPHYQHVLVIGGEVLSKVLDWTDRTTAVLFGDGAAGVLLETTTSDSSFLSEDLKTYGNLADRLQAGLTEPLSKFPANSSHHFAAFKMNGRDVYTFATHKVPLSIETAVTESGLKLEQVDWFILHQANSRIITQIAKRMKQPLEKFPMNIAEYGNTSGASVPLLFDEMIEAGKIKTGQIIVLSGFGGGLTVGTQIIKY
ncbi:MAG: beta-ketoacyl-ACP synthase III [Liquorilactobacillus nagelii]|uniref:beta-ketoacyl-ACP synthase III n=1 Tax=Liquorilactobacillus nagelii TaxID=82688 RepID=UPI0011D03EB8|nr:beta-ketoacyl-ACP synthase III [Liquorilactobacillus nagelii]MCC7616033.1 3-oxoacyl-ACP synthase [Liquorilactobacillus nagelii]MCI1633195.1 ketoacyl-ACP synthase III [Liquorilactobacillus nagelii]MCI1921079.1 ketoacyl-ACP synthase III [Liquorilactobacillus nagelii]MCI1975729.1 ketoacyl-ACP synthase III [Liquorilactobacillus nagelii]MCP9314340.1 ketoacyl-ACP synthase III [Liquorilactobacillus nagelii]